VINVRPSRADGVLLADLLFTSRGGIDLVRCKGKRAVSVGYDAGYEQTGPNTARQRPSDVITWHSSMRDAAGIVV
jgi:hypothetical protein